MNDQHEKRKYPRAPVKVEILCEELKNDPQRGQAVICFFSTDISIGGIFLETTVPFSVGDILHLQFKLDDNDRMFRFKGKVVRRVAPGAELLAGIGIEFLHVGPEEKKIIENYVINKIADQL